MLGDGGLSTLIKGLVDAGTAILKFANSDVGKAIIMMTALAGAFFGLKKAFVALQGLKTANLLFSTLSTSVGMFTTSLKNGLGVMGALQAGVSGLTTGLTALLGSFAPFLAAGAIVIGAYALYKAWDDTAGRLEDANSTLLETKTAIGSVNSEYEALKSKGDNLTSAEKQRLEYLTAQLGVLREQKAENERMVAQRVLENYRTQGTWTSERSGETINVEIRGQEALDYTAEKIKNLQAAIEDADKTTQDGKQSVVDYTNTMQELADGLAPVWEGYSTLISDGASLDDQTQANIDSIAELNLALLEQGGSVAYLDENLLTAMATTDMAQSGNWVLSESLIYAIEQFYGLASGSDAAKSAVAAFQIASLAATQTGLAAALEQDASGFVDLMQSAGFSKAAIDSARAAIVNYNAQPMANKTSIITQIWRVIKQEGDGLLPSAPTPTPTPTPTPSFTPSAGGGGGGGGGGDRKKEEEERKKKEKAKKAMEKLMDTQLKLYQKGKISAEKYYKAIGDKAKAYYKKGYLTLDEYKKYLETVSKEVLKEIEYDYERGEISATKYYNRIAKYALKYYKAGRISYDEYRDYIEKATKELFKGLEEEFRKGTRTADSYYSTVIKYADKLFKEGKITAKEYAEYVDDALDNLFDGLKDHYENGDMDAQAYYDAVLKYATKAYEEGKINAKQYTDYVAGAFEDLVSDVENSARSMRSAINAIFDSYDLQLQALEMYAQEQQDYYDGLIKGAEAELDALERQNKAREDAIELERLQQALEDAKRQKIKVFEDGEWKFVADERKVQEAQEAIDEFNREQAYEKEREAIESRIEMYEQQKQAWSDVVKQYKKDLDKMLLEAELGKTIEETIFGDKERNLENFKISYTGMIDEIIKKLKELASAMAIVNGGDDDSNDLGKGKAPASSGRKFASGSTSVPYSQWANVNERGDELFVPPTSGNMAYLAKGTGVVPHTLTENLMDLGRHSWAELKTLATGGGSSSNDYSVNINTVTVQANNPQDFIQQMRNLVNVTR